MTDIKPYQLCRGADIKCKLYKLLPHDMIALRKYKYCEGLNVLDEKFNPNGYMQPGGLYITSTPLIYYGEDWADLIAEVTLPDDAQVWTEENGRMKTDKLILKKPVSIFEYPWDWPTELKTNCSITRCGYFQTPERLMMAVRVNPDALAWVWGSRLTPDLCMEAVKKDGMLLYYANSCWRLTDEVRHAAIRQNGRALQFVKNPTREMCLDAVHHSADALEYVPASMYSECHLVILRKIAFGMYLSKQLE